MANLYGDEIRENAPSAELVLIHPNGAIDGDPSGADVLFFSLDLSLHKAALSETLKIMDSDSLAWVQSPGAGMDHPVWRPILDRGVRITNASGMHAEPIAQYVFTYVLHWERNVQQHQAQQATRKWKTIVSDDLTAKTIGIVGLGGIGLAVARVAKSFGMQVLGLRRSEKPSDHVDEHFVPAQLSELLARSDYVILCLPLTEETQHLIGASELAAMKSDAVLINVARGGVVDEPALIDVLQRRTIRGATLDVTEEEPLAESSPLWSLDNCVLTPHDAGYSPLAGHRLGRLFIENLRLYREGKTMRNEVV
jgi:phosphoglycerate dehydrogenase-like enzyme